MHLLAPPDPVSLGDLSFSEEGAHTPRVSPPPSFRPLILPGFCARAQKPTLKHIGEPHGMGWQRTTTTRKGSHPDGYGRHWVT